VIDGVLNSSAAAPLTPGASQQKAASQRPSKPTAFLPTASPPGACPVF